MRDSTSKPESAEGAEVSSAIAAARLNRLTEQIIGAAIEVHRLTGPGLMESAYEACLCYELSQRGLQFRRQVELPVRYKGINLDCGFRMDLLVEDAIVVELKTVDRLLAIHSAQLLTYLKLSGKKLGLLMNFNEPILTKGLKRLINHFPEPETPSPATLKIALPADPRQIPSAPSALQPNQQRQLQSSRTLLETLRLSVSAVTPTPLQTTLTADPRQIPSAPSAPHSRQQEQLQSPRTLLETLRLSVSAVRKRISPTWPFQAGLGAIFEGVTVPRSTTGD